jgi:hypothetical protein
LRSRSIKSVPPQYTQGCFLPTAKTRDTEVTPLQRPLVTDHLADILRFTALLVITFVAFSASWQVAGPAHAGDGALVVSPDAAPRAEPAGRGVTRAELSGRAIVLTLGLPVTVVDGGGAVSFRAPRGASVADALDLAGVAVGPLDRVEARDPAAVASGDVIKVVRVVESETTTEEPIPFAVTTVADSSLIVGRSFAVTPGAPGAALNTYRVRTLDGAVAERTLVSSVELRAPVPELRHVGTRPAPVPSEIESLIRSAAASWGADPDQLLRVAWCESRYNPAAYNASSGTSGLFQFMPRTWAVNSARAGYGGASVFDPAANANVAAYMFGQGQARQWSCK